MDGVDGVPEMKAIVGPGEEQPSVPQEAICKYCKAEGEWGKPCFACGGPVELTGQVHKKIAPVKGDDPRNSFWGKRKIAKSDEEMTIEEKSKEESETPQDEGLEYAQKVKEEAGEEFRQMSPVARSLPYVNEDKEMQSDESVLIGREKADREKQEDIQNSADALGL